MPDTTAAAPATLVSKTTGITNTTGGVAVIADFAIDGSDTLKAVSNSTSLSENAIVTGFPVTDLIGTKITDIKVRMVGNTTNATIDLIGAQLYWGGGLKGSEQTAVIGGVGGSTGYDTTFTGWASLPSNAVVEGSGFGVRVRYATLLNPALNARTDGVSVQVSVKQNIDHMLRVKLNATTQLTDYTSGRIYPLKRPQNSKLPAVTYQRVADPKEHASSTDPGYAHTRFQVTVDADSYDSLNEVDLAVRDTLRRWVSTTGGINIDGAFEENVVDLYDDNDNSDRGTYTRAIDYIIHHSE